MEPRLLLQWLLDRNGENTNSLAKKLKGKPSQPQIYKFLIGMAKEPKRETLAPIAEHFRIPLNALYDPDEADKAKAAIEGKWQPTASATKAQPAANSKEKLNEFLDCLIYYLEQVEPGNRGAVTAIIAALIQNPSNPGMRTALEAILAPAHVASSNKKAA
jgi:hypothetical protein